MKIICGMLLGLVAVASTLNWRASDELRSLRDAGESYQASMTRLAAAAQPVHAVRSDGGVRYECVTASGWRFSAPGEALPSEVPDPVLDMIARPIENECSAV